MPVWYPDLLADISERVVTGRRSAVMAVNRELLLTYWAVGRDILARQAMQGWGARVIDRLSVDLRSRFPDARGFSPRNLKYMRALAQAWPEEAIVQRSAAQLPWRHHQVLLDKLEDPDLRLWYATQAVENGWSRDLLVHQIALGLHERTGRAINNFAAVLSPADSDLVRQATRDPYVFDFLGTTERRTERDLEDGLVDHVQKFLLELGQGFAFVGRQVRLTIGNDEFFCDLLFYHLSLRRYVVIELKATAFEAGHLGQLGMYLAAVDDVLGHPDDAPAVGLLLCRSKNDVVAEYALRSSAVPIGVANWTQSVIADVTTALPAALSATLPSIEILESELATEGPAETTTGPAVPAAPG